MKRKYIEVDGLRVRVDKRKTYKNIRIRVLPPHGEVAATCPEYISDKMIKAFVKKNKKAIKLTIDQQREIYQDLLPSYEEGSRVRIFAKDYKLQVQPGSQNLAYNKDQSLILELREVADMDLRARVVDNFLRQVLRDRAQKFLTAYQKDMGLEASGLSIRKMKSKWGSCNTRTGHININLDLVRHDPACLEYIIVHELSHLKEPGHTKDFYKLVESFYPDYKKIEAYLDKQKLVY